ncbi:protease inhibitor I42 family protein [Streptomyces sp. NPDC058964]|uniref:protease inhibitor I42 family protein n=1 Tax=Streptomyces sp. NPDC058964 TaxID=3346681 RepID=UPI0036C3CF76
MTIPEHTEPGPVALEPGASFLIRLPALGSAGYTWTWELEGDTSVVEVAQGRPPAKELEGRPPGTSADLLFVVKALRQGRVLLHLEHRRPWEETRPPLQRRTYEIRVE